MDPHRQGEFAMIARMQSRLTFRSPRIIASIGDDCTVYQGGGNGKVQIATCDTLVEKVHFDLSTTTPQQLGRKTLAVNISDIAAMGGVPYLALTAIGIPKKLPAKFLDHFYDGLNEISEEYQIQIAGGDTVSSPNHFYVSITLLGEAKQNRWFSRSGAQPGNKILVTGTLGDSALGLRLLKSRKKPGGPQAAQKQLIQKHLNPMPRLFESRLLAQSKAKVTAMIDISDGLTQDLGHICKASNTGALLWETSLPTSQSFEKIAVINQAPVEKLLLGGGEDYELLFTLRPENVKNLIYRFKKAGRRLTCIGEITKHPEKIFLTMKNGEQKILPKTLGFDHFIT